MYIERTLAIWQESSLNGPFDGVHFVILHAIPVIYSEMWAPCKYYIINNVYFAGRSQWPRGLRHELSSLARKLGPWVRILLKAWMFVWVYSVFVLSCGGADPPSKESYRLTWNYETEVKQSVSRMSYAPKWGQQERERDFTASYALAISFSFGWISI
jgi:hypothetical protein